MVKVALDIGHGQNTYPPSKGVTKNGTRYPEHDFNSRLSIAIEKLLQSNGIQTVMYQKPYTNDIPLTKRTNYYNSQGVDLVYSIHANAGTSNVSGRCVFYWYTSKESKKLANIIVDEIHKAGYSTHGNGLHASQPNSWTNLHICRETKMNAVLVENGFMTNDTDFELIFGSKKDQYVKDMAVVHAKAICKFFGIEYNGKEISDTVITPTVKPVSKPTTPNKPSGNLGLVDWMNQQKMNSSYDNRAKLASKHNITGYKGTADQNNKLLDILKNGKNSIVNKPSKTIAQMADEVIAGKHGSGHENRRKSLGISQSEYDKVRSEVNKRAGVSVKPKPSKSVSQMAKEVIDGKHGNGHSQRQKSLGVNESTYNKIKTEVNKILGGSKKPVKKKTSITVNSKVKIKSSAKKYATGETIPTSKKNKSYTIMQVKSNRVLLKEIMSWVYKSDVQ